MVVDGAIENRFLETVIAENTELMNCACSRLLPNMSGYDFVFEYPTKSYW